MTNNLNRKKNIADATGCDSLKIQLSKEKDFVGKKKKQNKYTGVENRISSPSIFTTLHVVHDH